MRIFSTGLIDLSLNKKASKIEKPELAMDKQLGHVSRIAQQRPETDGYESVGQKPRTKPMGFAEQDKNRKTVERAVQERLQTTGSMVASMGQQKAQSSGLNPEQILEKLDDKAKFMVALEEFWKIMFS